MTSAADDPAAPSVPLQPQGLRVGDADRAGADEELRQHLAAGRINLDEYDQRAKQVFSARTQADIDAVFTDLPGPHASSSASMTRSSTPYPAYATPSTAAPAKPGGRNPAAAGLMAGVPILATILFFVCGFAFDGWAWSWVFFLLVPLAGAVLGPSLNASRSERRRLEDGR